MFSSNHDKCYDGEAFGDPCRSCRDGTEEVGPSQEGQGMLPQESDA